MLEEMSVPAASCLEALSVGRLFGCNCRRQTSPMQPLYWALPPDWLRVLKSQIVLKSFQTISRQRPSVRRRASKHRVRLSSFLSRAF